jgi:hypothetical protein
LKQLKVPVSTTYKTSPSSPYFMMTSPGDAFLSLIALITIYFSLGSRAENMNAIPNLTDIFYLVSSDL